jgi:hypothetical protein
VVNRNWELSSHQSSPEVFFPPLAQNEKDQYRKIKHIKREKLDQARKSCKVA